MMKELIKRRLKNCGFYITTCVCEIERYRGSISLENIQRIANAPGISTYKLFVEEKYCV